MSIKNFFTPSLNRPWVFYSSTLFSSLYNGIIGPLFVVYLLSINFNPLNIALLLATERLSIILFEIPTGLFADKYGRKVSVLTSYALMSLILFIWFFTQNFYLLILLSIFWGIAYTLQSGAKDSLMIECLNLSEVDIKRDNTFTKLTVYGNIGLIVGGLIAAILAFYYIKFIWLAAAVFNVILLLIYLLFIKEESLEHTVKSRNSFWVSIKANLLSLIKSKTLIYLFVVTFIISFVFSIYALSFPLLLKNGYNLPNYIFGYLGALSGFIGIFGALLGNKLSGEKGYYFTLGLLAVIMSALFILLGYINILIITIIILLLIDFANDGWYPIFHSFLNKFLPSNIRASLLSINSTLALFAVVSGELIAGFSLKFISSSSLLSYSGFVLVLIPFILWFIKSQIIIESKKSP